MERKLPYINYHLGCRFSNEAHVFAQLRTCVYCVPLHILTFEMQSVPIGLGHAKCDYAYWSTSTTTYKITVGRPDGK
jgi:hypothetical protein